jgi:hypothetical protein
MFRLLWKLALFFPIPIGVAWINWHVDPARVFGQHSVDPAWYEYEKVIAASLIAGRPEPLAAPHNELILDEMMFESLSRLDVLVLGDSVAKPIHKELYGGGGAGRGGGGAFFNATAFGVNLEEMLALDQLAIDKNLNPNLVVLEIQPAMLQPRRGAMKPNFSRLAHKAGIRLGLSGVGSDAPGLVQSILTQYDTLFSPSYCQYSIRLMLRAHFSQGGGRSQVVEQYAPQNQHLMYPDGSLQWCEVFLGQTPESIRQSVGKPPADLVSAVVAPLNDERCRLLETFVSDLLRSGGGRGAGAKVEFFLPSLNPWLFDEAAQVAAKEGRPAPGSESEEYLRSFAKAHGIRVHGSYDPRRLGITEEDYVDLFHLRRETIDRIWNREPK